MAEELGLQELGDAQVFEVLMGNGHRVSYAIDGHGQIYLNGDLHPRGAPQAMAEAVEEGVEWIAMSAVASYFPLAWLAKKCDGVDPLRIVIMHNLERFIRSRG